MKKIFYTLLISTEFLLGGNFALAQAVTTADTTTPDVATLQTQIAQLQAQIVHLQAKLADTQKQNAALQDTIQLSSHLQKGMHGDDVKRLQSVLASDPKIFSSENITGYYGEMTAKAVEAFQKAFGLDAVGFVGPHTMEKINELLKEHDIKSESDIQDGEFGKLHQEDSEDRQDQDNASSTSSTQQDNRSERDN